MIDPAAQSGSPLVRPAAAPRALPASSSDPAVAERGVRFQTLLEELDTRAREVARSAREPLSAESLPLAVENARASLDHALQLGQSLLEAYRQTATQASAGKPDRA